MKLEDLTCNCCGAPLEVPEAANFVTCNHCSTQLTVRRTGNATFTEQLDELSERTDRISERLDDLTANSDIATHDREWEFEREQFLVTAKDGRKNIPTKAGAIIGGLVISGFGCFWTAMAVGITSGAPDHGAFAVAKFAFPAFGILFVLGGVGMSCISYFKASEYQQAEQRYRRRRDEILRNK